MPGQIRFALHGGFEFQEGHGDESRHIINDFHPGKRRPALAWVPSEPGVHLPASAGSRSGPSDRPLPRRAGREARRSARPTPCGARHRDTKRGPCRPGARNATPADLDFTHDIRDSHKSSTVPRLSATSATSATDSLFMRVSGVADRVALSATEALLSATARIGLAAPVAHGERPVADWLRASATPEDPILIGCVADAADSGRFLRGNGHVLTRLRQGLRGLVSGPVALPVPRFAVGIA